MRSKLLLGAHVSVSGGLYKAIENAEKLGADVIQIFGASPLQWQAKLPSKSEAKRFLDALAASRVEAVYLHAAYLPNLASSDKSLFRKSVTNLAAHLKIADMLGAEGLIFHIGSAKGWEREQAVAQVVKGMRLVLAKVPGRTQLIMENAAGGSGKLGIELAELERLLREAGSARIKFCLDTAHAFESGLLSNKPADIKALFDAWDKRIGMENLVAIHANDSRTPYQSGVDRHQNIGEGYFGLKGFKNLAREKRLWGKAWMLEVPGFDGRGPDKRNLDILRACF